MKELYSYRVRCISSEYLFKVNIRFDYLSFTHFLQCIASF